MKIIGYGEDALTYWAIMDRMQEIKAELGIGDAPIELVLFRPSFGRKGSAERENEKLRVDPEFGEFDAIICTASCTFLIETKWSKSSELKNGSIKLGQPQTLRHKVFSAYIHKWSSSNEPGRLNWSQFYQDQNGQLETDSLLIDMPRDGRRLARNMEYILRKICTSNKQIKDVILSVRMSAYDSQNKPISADGFKVAMIDCPCEVSGFVALHEAK
ncbi:MAG TPA: hypothetical protein PLN21_10985 [Gemmatales bacterium]|nr:hypothetical protein [Gemmatales bacterium]